MSPKFNHIQGASQYIFLSSYINFWSVSSFTVIVETCRHTGTERSNNNTLFSPLPWHAGWK